jgi:quinol monooxygenase YgiN
VFALVVRFDVIPERLAEFDELVQRTIDEIRRKEPGTLAYLSTVDAEDPSTRVFIEVYRDRVAFDEHESMAHTRDFLKRREPMLRSFRVDFLESLAGTVAGDGGRP